MLDPKDTVPVLHTNAQAKAEAVLAKGYRGPKEWSLQMAGAMVQGAGMMSRVHPETVNRTTFLSRCRGFSADVSRTWRLQSANRAHATQGVAQLSARPWTCDRCRKRNAEAVL
jgi:hypothetical protein